MSTRVTNALIRANLKTLGEVFDTLMTRTEELMRIHNIGANAMFELIKKLKEYGVQIEFVPVTGPDGETVMVAKTVG